MHDAVVISVVAPSGIIAARIQLRQFHALSCNLKLIVGIWSARAKCLRPENDSVNPVLTVLQQIYLIRLSNLISSLCDHNSYLEARL